MSQATSGVSSLIENEEEQENRISASILSARVLIGAERVGVLQYACQEIGLASLTDPDKIELLQHCMAQTVQTLTDLSEEYLTTTLPLSTEQEALVKQVIELTESIDQQFAVIELDQRGVDHETILHRRMRLLLEQITFTGACYMPWVGSVWMRVHRLYISAWRHGSTLFRAPSLIDGVPEMTLQKLYATAVLTAEADPYQMPYRDIHKARTLASAFAGFVNITSFKEPTPAPDGHHQLLADDRVDKPALPYRSGRIVDHHNVVIELDECYFKLSERLESLEKDPRARDPLFVNSGREAVIPVYRHVLMKWGAQLSRKTPRSVANTDYDMLINYTNITETLNSVGEAEVNLERVIAATSFDESSTGIGLRIKVSTDLALRVGELIAIRENQGHNSHAWNVVVVRWIRKTDDGVVDLGAMKVPGRLYVAQLRGIHKMKPVGRRLSDTPQTSVLVTSTADVQGPMTAQMLVHRNMGDSDLVHWLSFSGTDRKVETMRPFVGTRYIVIYTCELSEPGDRPFLELPPDEKLVSKY